ncbi:Reticulon [Arabidopsis thaliana x Arabidopsis arenosa]|uniref:Reticulon-like protein n=1 Tax=Arabidopsis thaliana x Arabidopsis arenosa TaxID=1240361 RepID=A0A8T1Y2A6_9BRAS|nr:Reticulon [Arabidopsis thaliana x Arabidopsis arenosa]
MDTTTTPPSLRSNPRSALRLSRNNNTLVKSHIPSLDLVLSSPKNNGTPYPSPVSLNSPSSPVTLREILLSSPSHLRKSRTRLSNRFDMEAAEAAVAARRCKTKGGQNGLLTCASPSPRNFRRSRLRSEDTKENTEPIVVLTDEKKQKPRKQKKTGRSKKEKHSSVPLLPSSSPSSDQNEDVCQSDLERIRENISDLIMWRDVAKSTLWFGFGCICFLSSCFAAKGFNFSVFSAMSYLGLLFLGVSFLSNTLRQRATEEARRELKLSEEDVLRIARRMLPITNLAISKTSELFSGEPAMTLKVAPFVLMGAEYGYLITLWRLCAFGFFLSFTIPKLYSCYASQINQKVESARKRIVEAWGVCTHKKFVAGSAVTAFWNLTSLKTRFIAVFIIVVVIRYRRQNLQLYSDDEEEKHQEQTHPEQQESPEKKSHSPSPPPPPPPPRSAEEEQALVVVAESEAPKKL